MQNWIEGHYDDEGNWVDGTQLIDYSATVICNPEVDPWDSQNYDEKYQGDLVIPETVTYNDQVYEVRGCDGVAFVYAHNLTSISFPKTITWIDYGYLRDLNNLTSIIVDSENSSYTTIDGVLYNKEVTNVLVFPRKRGGVYRVPSTVTEFGQNGESVGYFNVDELIIPATITKIGSSAIGYGSRIKKVTIEDSESELTVGTGNSSSGAYDNNGNYISVSPLFGSCDIQEVYWGRNVKPTNKYSSPFACTNNLNKVTFGPKVTTIPQYSFYNCYSLNTVDLLGGIGQWCNFDFTLPYSNPLYYNYGGGTVLFNGAALSGDVVIPDDVTAIPSHAFQFDCSGVTSLSLPAGLTSIADGAFDGMTGLQTIMLANGNTNFVVNDNVLYNQEISKILCFPKLRVGDYTMPLTITQMANTQFHNCVNLTGITLSANLKTLPDYAFEGCNQLQFADIPSSLETIGAHAFEGLSNFAQVTIEAGSKLKTINESAFQNCTMLQNLTLPASLETIGSYAFHNCTGIEQLTFEAGSKLKSISNYAFSGCSKFTELSIPASVTNIGSYAFSGCSSLKELVLEDGSEDLTFGYSSNGIFLDSPIETFHLGRNLILNSSEYSSYSQFNGSALHNVEISNSVTKVPARLFYGCDYISQINFLGTIVEWCKISFGSEHATPFQAWVTGAAGDNPCPILHLNGSPLHSQVNIPEGALKIGSYAFAGQLGVSTVIVPSTVLSIETHAFNGERRTEDGIYTSNIDEVSISGTNVVPLMVADAFGSNTMIYVDDNLTNTYRQANVWSELANQICPAGFKQVTVDLIAMANSPALLPALNALEQVNGDYRITALTNLKIRGTMNGWDLLMIRNKMPNLRTLDLEEAGILDNDGGAEYYQGYHTRQGAITSYSFYGLKNLRKVILPNGIEEIEPYSFSESGIITMDIPGTVANIREESFRNCNSLKELNIGKGVETIGWSAFQECYNLRSVSLPSTLRTIGYNAFWNCYNLEKLVLPTSLRTIESNAFASCYNLREIDFAEGLQTIGYGAFENCNHLKNLHLPTSLKRIENNAFNWCSSLTEVHVPSMITEIGDYAFKNCGLRAVYAYTVVPVQINQNTFDYAGVDLYAPDNSFYAYYLNTQWSQFLDVKSFPARYTSWYTPRNYDLEVNTNIYPIKNVSDDDPADASMESGSGLIFIGDGEQLVKGLIMNWQHGANYPSLIENGNLSVEELKFILNVYPGRWYFFSFPFDVNLKDVKHDGKWVWRYYDGEARAENGSGGWKNVEGDVLKANVGYIYQCNTAGDLELPVNHPVFSNEQTGNEGLKEVPLESYPADDAQNASWNFVGNPNLSYYDLDAIEASGFTAPITVWDDEQQTYTAVVPGDDEYDFHPFQAYFVQTPEDADNLTFEDENRSTYIQTEQAAGARRRAHAARRINEKRLLVNLTLTDGETTDKTRVIFNDDNSMDYEAGLDANKFMSMASVPQIYTLDAKNVKYAVNARPNGKREVRVGFKATNEGEYTIAADRMDCSMALKDNLTGTIHMFDKGDYNFLSEAGTYDDRFTLISGFEATAISSKTIEGVNISTFDGGIVVNGATAGDVTIYKTNGVKATTISGTGTAMLPAGTYIVSYDGKSMKVLVK
ncbi:MAG: leucine-rich repeat domain-containing protein [Prevotella sp.]|nr:leucine-rich repeat domain-containing protein [Prevotella sp.]